MLALFLGTAALPHILIRYYTVPNPASARKSTIVAIAAIGFFYILTLFMGLGAMANGVLNPAIVIWPRPCWHVPWGSALRDHFGHCFCDSTGYSQRVDRGGIRRCGP